MNLIIQISRQNTADFHLALVKTLVGGQVPWKISTNEDEK